MDRLRQGASRYPRADVSWLFGRCKALKAS
jgi:hypothetical protein